MRYTENDGFCARPIVDNIVALTGHYIELEAPVPCGFYPEEFSGPLDEPGCMLHQEYGYEYGPSGIDRGFLAIEITECGDMNCMHIFDIHFTRR